ncbi:ABC transporter permease [Desemzia sp. FAM 23991]|uniref:ABC transporter permease n=1 Tax=unclassified Desemzia TaxID=2685243 RepID=UPI0038852C48
MFSHLQKYAVKNFFRNKDGVAFGVIFPLVFGLIYLFAFQGLIATDTVLETVPVAMVFEGNEEEIDSAKDSFSSIATPASLEQDELVANELTENDYMMYYETDSQTAQQLLEDGAVEDIIYVDNTDQQFDIALTVAPNAANSMSSTIIYTALNTMASINGTINTLYTNAAQSDDPQQSIMAVNESLASSNMSKSFIADSAKDNGTTGMSIFYYACLAYICIFFMSIGVSMVTDNEANYSPAALLVTASPVPKSKRFRAMFITGAVSCLAIVYLLLIIYNLNGVPLGNDPFRLVALMTLGVLVGLLLGTAVASLLKANTKVLIGISIAVPLVLGALSGLMVIDLKYFIMEKAPWLAKINPVSLINDAIYYLNSYPTYEQYNENMLILSAYAIVCLMITLMALRRTDYENL